MEKRIIKYVHGFKVIVPKREPESSFIDSVVYIMIDNMEKKELYKLVAVVSNLMRRKYGLFFFEC